MHGSGARLAGQGHDFRGPGPSLLLPFKLVAGRRLRRTPCRRRLSTPAWAAGAAWAGWLAGQRWMEAWSRMHHPSPRHARCSGRREQACTSWLAF
jgi:hypothetical protein